MQAVADTVTQPFKLAIQLAPERIVEIDHREVQFLALEQPGLGLAIGLHTAVVIQVVPGQVGKHGSGHGQLVDPALIQGVGRHFHHRSPATIGPNAMQHTIHLHHVRCGVGGRHQVARHAITQGAQHAARGAGVFQQLGDVLGNGSLAVGTSDPNQPQMPGRMLEESGGDAPQLGPQTDNRNNQGARAFMAFPVFTGFQQHCGSTGSDGIIHIVFRWRGRTRQGNKGVARSYRPAVRLKAVDGHVKDRWHVHNALKQSAD